jgi:RND family efflux transporter MFP subunit
MRKPRNLSGKLIGGVLLAAGVAAVFLYKAKPEEEPEDTTVRPVKSWVVGADAPRPKLYFPGTVEADVEVDLSFEVGGRLVEFPVRRGTVVEQGAVLGRLDPRNFENQVKNAEADLERAQSSLGRIEKALRVNAVSQDEYSQARAAVAKAEAQLAIQRKALDDTRLEARFRGVVSDVFADQFDTVSPGQPVLKLQDVATLTIAVSVPEGYVQMASSDKLGEVSFAVRFDSLPGRSFPVQLKEFVTTADPVTQTYRATFSMEKPADVFLLPGMSGTVVVEGAKPSAAGEILAVPSNAVGFASDGAAFVWVLDAQDGGVYAARRQPVALGKRLGENVEVRDGLAPGARIAAAGVAILTEGRRVRLLDEGAAAAETAP